MTVDKLKPPSEKSIVEKPSRSQSSLWGRRLRTGSQLNVLGLLLATIVIYIILSFSAPGFLTGGNQLGMLRDAATIAIAAWGMTLVIIGAEIDISIGPAVAFATVIFAESVTTWNMGVIPAALLTLVIGTAFGALAGVLRAYFNVPSFIATLGLWSSLRGLAQYITNALPIPLPDQPLINLAAGTIWIIPTPAVIMLVLFAVFAFIARKTVYGKSVFAIGGNPNAARLSGINIRLIRVLLFATTGFLSALSGLLLAARIGSGSGGAAQGLEFNVIAAVVIGGTSLSGGQGSMLGTFLGVIFVTVIGNGLVLLGVNSFFQQVVSGIIIVAAVLINILLLRRHRTQTA
jgi:ribose/xylose/arabinose/galactoside ABC-type transport system permease subunit